MGDSDIIRFKDKVFQFWNISPLCPPLTSLFISVWGYRKWKCIKIKLWPGLWQGHYNRPWMKPGPWVIHALDGVNGRTSDRAIIQATTFQLLYLLQLYSKNLTIVFEPFTGILNHSQESCEWIDDDLGALLGRIWADITFEGYHNDPGTLFPYRIATIWTFY